MATLPLENKSDTPLRIMLEPWAREYDVRPGEKVELSGKLDDMQIDYGEDNFLAFWVADDVVVLSEGQVVSPLTA
jgi:hypothetical protein